MQIGIVSDTHNNTDNARQAAEMLRERGIEHVVHCGDITTPQIVELFADFRVWFVYGNMDRDTQALRQAVSHNDYAAIDFSHAFELEGEQLGVCHGHQDSVMDRLKSMGLDYIFHGHTHTRRDETVNDTRMINPGALGGTKKQARTFAVLDLPSGDLEIVRLA